MTSYPFVSVVIPTYNRHNIIRDTVNHLLRQNYPHFEIIVIDHTQSIPDAIKKFFDEISYSKVRHIHIHELGLTYARNLGIKNAKGEIILFVDDDIKPYDNNLIMQHVKNYVNPDVVGVGGRILDPRYLPENNPKRILKLTKWGTFHGGKNGTVRTEIDVLPGGNMSFKKKEALLSGLFDTQIAGTAQGEEVTFSLKLLKNSGKKFIFDPKAALYHYALTYGGDFSRSVPPLYRHFSRFYNQTLICLKNSDVINPVLFLIGRMGAMFQIALKSGNIKSLFWLPKAVIYGCSVYKKRTDPKSFMKKVRKDFRIDNLS